MSGQSFMSEDTVKTQLSYKALMIRLWPYIKRHPWQLFFVVLTVVLLSVSSRLLPTIIGYAIDEGILKKDWSIITFSLWAYLIVRLLYALFSFVSGYSFLALGNRVLYYVRDRLFNHVLNLPMDYFNRTPTGRIVTRLTNDIANLGELFSEGLLSIFTNSAILISIVISMLLISVQLTALTIVFVPLFILIAFFIGGKIRDVLGESKKKLATLNSFVAENLNGARVVQLYNREEQNLSLFKSISSEYKDLTLKSIHYYSILFPVMGFLGGVTLSAALLAGASLKQTLGLEVGAMIAFILHVQDFVPPLRNIIEKYQQFQNSLTSADRVFSLMDEDREEDMNHKNEFKNDEPRTSNSVHGLIEIRDLSFKYQSSETWVLRNISQTINPGERIALVGRTGSGKSTLVSLLQRFYPAPESTIFIDGLALEQWSMPSLRQNLGVVQQDPFVFKGSIEFNISLGDDKITSDRVSWAASQVGLTEHLKKSGRDLRFNVEERGANLSLGERQLIAFARILAFDPQILILDEATANVDSETEELIQRATMQITQGRTSIVVAHRLSTLKDCHRIFLLDRGQLRELQSLAELESSELSQVLNEQV